MDIDYRKIRMDDSSLLVDFIKTIASDTDNLAISGAETEALDEKSEEVFISSVKNSSAIYIIALTGGMIIGSCEIRIPTNCVRLRHRGEMAIAVRKDFWGRGIAQHLFSFALSEAKDIGIRKINLETRSDNDRMRAFCERNGFVMEGKDSMMMVVDGIFIDGVRYGLVL